MKRQIAYALAGGLAVLLAWTACVGEDPDASGSKQGAQDQPCYANSTCLKPLVCVEGICRVGDGGASGANGDGATSGGTSSGNTSSGATSSGGTSSGSTSSGGTSSGDAGCTSPSSNKGPSCGGTLICNKGDYCCTNTGTCTTNSAECTGSANIWQCENDSHCPAESPVCCINMFDQGANACGASSLTMASSVCVKAAENCVPASQLRTCTSTGAGCTTCNVTQVTNKAGNVLYLKLCGP